MCGDHTVFSYVKEVVEHMLVPCGRVGGWEAAETDGEEVHVQVGYLCPGIEGRGQAERCNDASIHIFTMGLLNLGGFILEHLPSYHHPFPTPRSSPSFVLGTGTSFS